MELRDLLGENLKTPWIAGTHIKSIKRAALIKYSISLAVQEIKEKNLQLKYFAILALGLCKIFNELGKIIHDELEKLLSHNFETPHKPRMSGIDKNTNFLINSSLRYSGASFKLLTGSNKKGEGFRRALAAKEDITYEINMSGQDDKIFMNDAFLLPGINFDELMVDANIEFRTPDIEIKSMKSEFKSANKSTKKKKIRDDVTVIKKFKELPLKNIPFIVRNVELIPIPNLIKEFFRKNCEEVGQFADVKEREINFQGFQEPNLPEYFQDYIQPMNLDPVFELEMSQSVKRITPRKSTQVMEVEKQLGFASKFKGKCKFRDIHLGFDRLKASRAFLTILVLASTDEIVLYQVGFYSDIELKWNHKNERPESLISQMMKPPQWQSQHPNTFTP